LTLTLKINRVPDSLKDVPSLVKIHWRMLILCSQGCYGRTVGRMEGRKDGRTDSSVTISLCNFIGEGIIRLKLFSSVLFTYRGVWLFSP
jgi:hypothetical protein